MFDDKKFLEARNFPRGICQMKKRPADGGMPREFGFIIPDDLTTIYLTDHERPLKRSQVHYPTLDALLADGWLVD